MTTLKLYGVLAEIAGRDEWRFHVNSPAEALRALAANCPAVLDYFYENTEANFNLLVEADLPVDSIEALGLNIEPKMVHLMPAVAGAGSEGGLLALIGLVIIGIVLAIPTFGASMGAYSALAAGAALTTGQSIALVLGASLALQGVSAMLAPKLNTGSSERPENKPSQFFNGAVNTYRQGNCIAVGYGTLRIGSQVISAGVRAVEVPQEEE